MTQSEITTEKELLVDLKLHNISAEMLKEFAIKIVKPYFGGNMNKAINSLVKKALEEETIINKAVIIESNY